MKSSLKRQTNIPTQNNSQKYEQSTQRQQDQQQPPNQQIKGAGKFDLGSFQPIKATKQSQKLRIAQIQTENVQNKLIKKQENVQQKQINPMQQDGIINKQSIKGQNIQQDNMVKQQPINVASDAQVVQVLSNFDQQQDTQNLKNGSISNLKEDQIEIKPIVSSQKLPIINKLAPTNLDSFTPIQQQDQQVNTDTQNMANSYKIQQMITINKNEQNIVTQKQSENQKPEQPPFEYRISNRRRLSQKSQLDISINKSLAEINEGYQERDMDKEKLDIRKLAKINSNQNQRDEQEERVNKDIQEQIFNPQLSNYKGDKKEDYFVITRHTKLIDRITITSVINFEMINQIDPELRFYHLLFDLIDKTEKTVQQEYAQSPEFLYYLSVLNNIIKTSFSKIATNRRKSIIIEQQQKVKECLFNKWETSKQKVMQGMIEKYLKKYDKFKKIDEKVEQSKEYNYLKRTISGLVAQSTTTVIPQKEILQKIEEQQKHNIIEIEQQKNMAIMKPVVEGLELIKKGQEYIIEQQNRMSKSYEKLTKIVFPDWKEIDSFDEFGWLQSQQDQLFV